MLETIGLIVYASLFVLSGINHIRNHSAMVSYASSTLGNLAFLGGAPTGVFLVAAGVAAAFSQLWAFYALAGFLAAVTLMFHRNFLSDPGGFKGLSLLGASLALAALI